MPEEAGITRIQEVRGKDGSVAYEVSGGKHGEGEASFFIPKYSLHDYEKQHGKKELQEMLKRSIEASIQSRKEDAEHKN